MSFAAGGCLDYPGLIHPDGRTRIVQSIIAVASGGVFGPRPRVGKPGDYRSNQILSIRQSPIETGLIGTFGLLAIIAMLFNSGFSTACMPLIPTGGIWRQVFPFTWLFKAFYHWWKPSLLTLSGVTLRLFLWRIFFNDRIYRCLDAAGLYPTNQPPTCQFFEFKPFLVTSALVMLGLIAASLISGWWVYRPLS